MGRFREMFGKTVTLNRLHEDEEDGEMATDRWLFTVCV